MFISLQYYIYIEREKKDEYVLLYGHQFFDPVYCEAKHISKVQLHAFNKYKITKKKQTTTRASEK